MVEFTNAGGFSVCFAAEHNNEWDGVRVSNWQELTDELIRYGEIKAQIDRDSLEKVEEKADKLIEMVKEIDLTLTDKSKKKIRKKKERDVESENENRD
ncbi:MAG: hypothetical protein AMQ22_00242 [Candidatus Methanofastidiosum methylothiophilum]|uniref:Uncharacterized protein n=1 Tax=Candidatus Methanofastidiosum methylothiophilum TaxID=1705564 RepID=A0A150J8P4_9EURY|nr:MAG: hypothetical protein APG11_00803 [Candidatus Methanofastidiosum methylthiophilus]KYC53571.1 MAG: hypothetical protein AMQ22_00242 [Candidatus Methanofastidiosum methylthiophilus]